MQLLKYHILTVIALLLASFSTAYGVKNITRDLYNSSQSQGGTLIPLAPAEVSEKSIDEKFADILASPFFASYVQPSEEGAPPPPPSAISDLELLGTISGPWSIARALIKKKGQKGPEIYALYSSRSTSNDVYGYKLVRIGDTKVYLKQGSERYVLELFAKERNRRPSSHGHGNKKIGKTLSKSFLQQKVFSNPDKAMRGLRAGPNMKNGKVDGYRLVQVRPSNILYHLGLRSGDILKRINGKKIDSTVKLMKMWETLKDRSRVTVDVKRGNNVLTYDINITQ